MSKLQIGSITVIVNGYTINNGLPYFQKAVPRELRQRIGKSTIKVPLKKENGNEAVQCHRLNDKYNALFKAMKEDESIVPSEAKLAAFALLDLVGLKVGDGRQDELIKLPNSSTELFNAAEILQDFLTEKDYTPSQVTSNAFAALSDKLPVLLSEAFSVYLENHSKGLDKVFIASQKQHWDKLVNFLGDKPITALTRKDAKAYRDFRLSSGVTASTVKREISVIHAVLAKAIRELSLATPNVFSSIEIPSLNRELNKRQAYKREEIQLLVNEARKLDDEQRRIVIVLAFTGARLAEIVGLRRQDLDSKTRSVHIRAHADRPLKTESSNRSVPLLPIAFDALSKQSKDTSGDFLFPSYARHGSVKADSASATLNKWANKLTPGKTMHCFRHALRDQLRAVMCPESVSKEIGGWSTANDVSVHYGQGYPIDLKRDWLVKAYSWFN